jgi:hypothetical protein
MRRTLSFTLIAVLLGALLLSVFAQAWGLPATVLNVAATFPEVQPIVIPSIIWGIVAIACWQAVAVIGLRIAALARDRTFNASAYGLLRAAIGCLITYIVLAVFAHAALTVLGWATAGVVLGLFGSGLLALSIVGSLAYFLLSKPAAAHYTRHSPAPTH